ncbi:hypothetical protein AMTRI_Chr07g29690 [Amborella trichopoda]
MLPHENPIHAHDCFSSQPLCCPISTTSLLPLSSSLTPLPCTPPLTLPSPCSLPLSRPLQSSPPTIAPFSPAEIRQQPGCRVLQPTTSCHRPHLTALLSATSHFLSLKTPSPSLLWNHKLRSKFYGFYSEIWERMAGFWPESEQNRLVYSDDGEIRWFIRGFLFLGSAGRRNLLSDDLAGNFRLRMRIGDFLEVGFWGFVIFLTLKA